MGRVVYPCPECFDYRPLVRMYVAGTDIVIAMSDDVIGSAVEFEGSCGHRIPLDSLTMGVEENSDATGLSTRDTT